MNETLKTYDAIVLGAGAAGMMCAATAGQRGRSVLLIDHADRPGKKILISGGGRCNFTNIHSAPECFISSNKHFAKSALRRYTPQDFISLVERYAIDWHEKTLGQLFCDKSAKQIVAMLEAECANGGVKLLLGQGIRDVDHADGKFTVRLDQSTAAAKSLVIATGGPSIPKMGATGFAYDLARRFDLSVIPPRPGLVPLTLGGAEQIFGNLTGLSADVIASCAKTSFREAALFTHRGLSGPAILQISSYWSPGQPVTLNFQAGTDAGWLLEAKRSRPKSSLATAISNALPGRLAKILTNQLEGEFGLSGDLGNLPDRALKSAEEKLTRWPFEPTGTEGYAKAEVTVGGIDTAGLSSRTMQAKAVPGLYAIGEAVDVTGWLGGYNFQWAWSSGWACGQDL
ncbi:MAG: NAD(P)/FAD-dependent oxidoreductase [Alphaproteobacteria bacterium]|nr:NAD(P)/FAD-dependent oxidoreductase [Alphaproteobacteria bacterium]